MDQVQAFSSVEDISWKFSSGVERESQGCIYMYTFEQKRRTGNMNDAGRAGILTPRTDRQLLLRVG